jgi:hypothetical protein
LYEKNVGIGSEGKYHPLAEDFVVVGNGNPYRAHVWFF